MLYLFNQSYFRKQVLGVVFLAAFIEEGWGEASSNPW